MDRAGRLADRLSVHRMTVVSGERALSLSRISCGDQYIASRHENPSDRSRWIPMRIVSIHAHADSFLSGLSKRKTFYKRSIDGRAELTSARCIPGRIREGEIGWRAGDDTPALSLSRERAWPSDIAHQATSAGYFQTSHSLDANLSP
jgi:hypothetical protein